MNTKTRLALYGFIAGLSAILLTVNQADVALAEPSGDEGRCNTGADDCSDWGDFTRDNTDGPSEHAPGRGIANVLPSHPSELGCILVGDC